MNRIKEILFVIGLSFLFFATVQLTLTISKKPSEQQRIPVFKDASFELSAQPINLIKELLSTELFKQKNQVFINQLHKLTTSQGKNTKFDGIEVDLQQAMTFLMIKSEDFNGPLIHFQSLTESNNKKIEKHYVQLGEDVFYSPSTSFTSKQANWILNQVKWETSTISRNQLLVHQQLNGQLSQATIKWNDNELSYVTKEMTTNQKVILSPRYFHYSNVFPVKLETSIPEEFSLRCMLDSLEFISVNYDGGKLTEDQHFPFAPSFEVLLEYQNPSSMESALRAAKSVYDTLDWKEQGVSMGNQEIFFKRTSPKTLYICSNKAQFCPNGNPNLTRCNNGFLCKGDLGRLTSIKNTGWAGLVLDMIPAFRASKELFDATKDVSSTKNGMTITFKPGKDVLHELLKTLVVYQQE